MYCAQLDGPRFDDLVYNPDTSLYKKLALLTNFGRRVASNF